MKTHHCTTLHHHDNRPGVAPVCTTAPPAPPPLGECSGGGAASRLLGPDGLHHPGLIMTETLSLHDGDPIYVWRWDEGTGLGSISSALDRTPKDQTEKRKSTTANMTGADQ